MNFFERQAAARRRSTRLVVLFALAVAATVLAVNAVVLLALGLPGRGLAVPSGGVVAFVTLVTLAVIGTTSLLRIHALRAGGAVVARELGGSEVPADATAPDLRRLRNVVEEIAIASGVPVPALYVLEDEAGINAFAAGYAPGDAAVAVTRGALDRLNRDELQGVIAHEFSHVLHGDMRLNIRLLGALAGLTAIGLAGRRLLQAPRFGRSRGTSAAIGIGLALVAIGAIGLTAGRLIKAGLSRQRELLADASAVQFTRQAGGLAGALKKIAGLPAGAALNAPAKAEEVAHMLFGDGVGGRVHRLFATHPPLLERIRALEPGFNDAALARLGADWSRHPPQGLEEDRLLGLAGAADGALPPADAQVALRPGELVAEVGEPGDDDLARAHAIGVAIPPALDAAVRGHDGAVEVVLALLLSAAPDVHRVQRAELVARHGEALAEAVLARRASLAELHPQLRLPLASLAFPQLRQRPPAALRGLLDTCYALVHADGRVTMFEYCLGVLLHRQLREASHPGERPPPRRRLHEVEPSALALFAVLAAEGHADPAQARRAFLAGLARTYPRSQATWQPPVGGLRVLDQGWSALEALEPVSKALLLEGLVETIGHDGRLAIAEVELLRTVCALLHCPLPPALGRA